MLEKNKTIPCKTLASAVAAELSHRPLLKMKENGNYATNTQPLTISNLLIGHNVTKGEESDPSRQYSQFLLDFD